MAYFPWVGAFEQQFSKNSNARGGGGLPGRGMLKLRFDRYITFVVDSCLRAADTKVGINSIISIIEMVDLTDPLVCNL